ncbi:MAG: FRG domain-containing protein [Pseudomonadota bacterium]
MKEFKIDSWDQFHEKIGEIRDEYGSYETAGIREENSIFFRGQADARWGLKSTLERYQDKSWTIEAYAKLLLRCKSQIETYNEKNWDCVSHEKVEEYVSSEKNDYFINIPFYSFWVYLRHHGFPSPLLDWSKSPYIAFFFALAEKSGAEYASVFAYIAMPKGAKAGWSGSPVINEQGPYVTSHKRHFLQQSCYTICTKVDGRYHEFVEHKEVFKSKDMGQDLLFKILIPISERIKALKYLNDVNINFFSLFQTEDALVKTLAIKEMEKIGRL